MVSKRLRLINWLIDTLICVLIFGIILYLFFPSRPEEKIIPYVKAGYLGLTFLYYFLSEYFFRKTPGKFITRTRVSGGALTSKMISPVLIRTICRFIPFEGAYILINDDDLTLHDLISKTKLSKF